LQKEPTRFSWEKSRLKPIHLPEGAKSAGELEGELVGGNLTVWTSALGTPFESRAEGKLLFFEDVGEPLYRVDRMIHQLAQAGQFRGVKAPLLGTFENCGDPVPPVLKSVP